MDSLGQCLAVVDCIVLPPPPPSPLHFSNPKFKGDPAHKMHTSLSQVLSVFCSSKHMTVTGLLTWQLVNCSSAGHRLVISKMQRVILKQGRQGNNKSGEVGLLIFV